MILCSSDMWSLCHIQIILLLLTSWSALNQAHSESCFQSDTTYVLCTSNGNNVTQLSHAFTEHQFAEECHGHFVNRILNKSCETHEHHDHTTNAPLSKRRAPSFFLRFACGLTAVFVVSALSLVGLLALPFLYQISFDYVLKLFTAIAIGTLFGDAVFHLIPIVFNLHNHNHHDGHNHHQHGSLSVPHYQWKMLLAVSILYIFYLLEVFLHWFAHYKHDHNHKSGESHEHHQSQTLSGHTHSVKNGEIRQYTRVDVDPDIEHSHLHHNHTHHNLHQHFSREVKTPSICSNGKAFFSTTSLPCTPGVQSNDIHLTANPFACHPTKDKISADHQDPLSMPPKVYVTQFSDELAKINPIVRQLKAIKSTGWMVLFGDSIHNFADGLAISAAFSQDLILGVTTTIAVACHELPHELGDYAVLLQSGFSHSRALLWNFLSATTAILGFFVGTLMSDTENACQWIFAATIGMFLYIALVDLLPTLLSDEEFQWKRFLVVNCGFLFGILVMFLLAIFEDRIKNMSVR